MTAFALRVQHRIPVVFVVGVAYPIGVPPATVARAIKYSKRIHSARIIGSNAVFIAAYKAKPRVACKQVSAQHIIVRERPATCFVVAFVQAIGNAIVIHRVLKQQIVVHVAGIITHNATLAHVIAR